MELEKIEELLEKYHNGETNNTEENELRIYFRGGKVAQHLVSYQPLFMYFDENKKEVFNQEIPLPTKKRNKATIAWGRIAASLFFIFGIVSFFVLTKTTKKELGTFENPEIAFKETQKALDLLSTHLNTGIESVQYVNEFEKSKNIIFKK